MNIKDTTEQTLKQLEKITGGKLTLGKLLWAIRQSADETQVSFADKLDVSRQFLCDLEHDRKTVNPRLAAIYADKLGYSKEQFVRLCLQYMVDKAGIKVTIDVTPAPYRRKRKESRDAA